MDLLPGAQDQRKTNLDWEERTIQVENIRDVPTTFQLDTHGFCSRPLPGFTELSDEDTVISKYIPAVKKMLQTELQDVGTVFVFDWRVITNYARL